MKNIMKNYIECKDIVKVYLNGPVSTTALRGINAKFESGNIYIIFGPSGSGKSTLLNIIGGLLNPTSGVIKFNIDENEFEINRDTQDLFEYRKSHVSYIFQEPIFLSFLNVEENIRFIINSKKNNEKEKIKEVLEMTNLLHKIKSYPYQLSGGEKQRLSIAMALSLNNKIWLCDEPTGTLDSENKKQIINLLKKIKEEDPSKIMIIVTHDPIFQSIASQMLIIKDGLISLVIDKENIDTFSEDILLYKVLNQKLDDTIKKERILKRLEEIKRELEK